MWWCPSASGCDKSKRRRTEQNQITSVGSYGWRMQPQPINIDDHPLLRSSFSVLPSFLASPIPIEIESRCKPGTSSPFHGIGLDKRNRIDTGSSSFPLFYFQTRATILDKCVSSCSSIFISGQHVIAKHDPNSQPGCLGFTRLLETGEKRQRRRSW